MSRDILVSEVGPRDGLQSIKTIMPTSAKKAWITALAASGLREIEVGSFVPAHLLPQLADTAEIVAHALTIAHLTVAVLAVHDAGATPAVDERQHDRASVPEGHEHGPARRPRLLELFGAPVCPAHGRAECAQDGAQRERRGRHLEARDRLEAPQASRPGAGVHATSSTSCIWWRRL
jgi:hypothetical protein